MRRLRPLLLPLVVALAAGGSLLAASPALAGSAPVSTPRPVTAVTSTGRTSVTSGTSAACASVTPGMRQLTTSVGGVTRAYSVYVPRSWSTTRRAPVVYLFHGSGGDATGTIYGSKMDVQADKDGFLVVAPQALGTPTSWDVDHGTDVAGSDAAFTLQLLRTVPTAFCANAARQYVAGYSSGSQFTHALACYGGFPVAGYAGAAAQSWADWCPNPQPFDFVYFHGTADPYVPFDGNDQVPSVAWSATTMAAKDRCEAQPTVTQVQADVTQYLWSRCANGRRILVDVVQGGGHIWPGADAIASLGPQTTLSADQVISTFYRLAS